MSELLDSISLASKAAASAAEKLEKAILKNEEIDARIKGTGATLHSIISSLSESLNKLAEVIKPMGDVKGIVRLAPYTYVISTQGGFFLIRSKPEHLSLNFSKDANVVSVKSRNVLMEVSPSDIKLKAKGFEVQVATNDPGDFVAKVNEIRNAVVEIKKKTLIDRLETLVELQAKRR